MPWLVGGAADLSPSTKTMLDDRGRRRLRARTATAAATSISASASTAWPPAPTAWRSAACAPTSAPSWCSATTCSPAIRLAALMGLPVTFVFTHDFIGLGEDGPTHQPIEQLAALRAIAGHARAPPRRRQRDGRGLARRSWRRTAPPASSSRARRCRRWTATTLRRRDRRRPRRLCAGRRRGRAAAGDPDRHRQRGVALRRGPERPRRPRASRARVVSMPSWELFEAQPPGLSRPGAAAGGRRPASRSRPARRWAGTAMSGPSGEIIAMRRFGASAPIKDAAAALRLHRRTMFGRRPRSARGTGDERR